MRMDQSGNPTAPDRATAETLSAIARRYGTPTYAFDIRQLRTRVDALRAALPAKIDILYSLKANASLGICEVFAACGLGADIASAGEFATAIEAGFAADRIFVAGPYKLPETIAQLRSRPDAILSIDSPSELEMIAREALPNPAVLRLRPDYRSSAVVAAGSESRFGFLLDDLRACRAHVGPNGVHVIGFHVFSGSQLLDTDALVAHFRGAMDLSLRAADRLGIAPTWLNLGGGFGLPYGPQDETLDLAPIARELDALCGRVSAARIVLELGRYLVGQAGWYLTTVLGHQNHQGEHAVVVDGGTHQRADLCGLCLRTKAYPPTALDRAPTPTVPTTVLGCLSLPTDVLAESTPLPALSPGDVLAFANAGAYGLWSSPALFHASPLPAEVAFDGTETHVMRPRQSADWILQGQQSIRQAETVS